MHVNALSFFLLLIAREIWTWSQQSRGFVKHKRTPGFYHTMPVKRAVQPFSCCSYCAAVILLLRTSCCRHWSSTYRKQTHWAFQEKLDLGICQISVWRAEVFSLPVPFPLQYMQIHNKFWSTHQHLFCDSCIMTLFPTWWRSMFLVFQNHLFKAGSEAVMGSVLSGTLAGCVALLHNGSFFAELMVGIWSASSI